VQLTHLCRSQTLDGDTAILKSDRSQLIQKGLGRIGEIQPETAARSDRVVFAAAELIRALVISKLINFAKGRSGQSLSDTW
jgi:hypothetical protein